MPDPEENGHAALRDMRSTSDEFDSVPTSPADIESAGRSCMAIIVFAVIILLVLLVWIGYRSLGGQ